MSYNNTPTRSALVTFASQFSAAARSPEVVKALKEAVPAIATAADRVGNVISTFRSVW